MMRFGLIGYGLWGKYHARAIVNAPGAELAAIACASEQTAAQARADFPQLPVVIGYQALLAQRGQLGLNAVDIVVPNYLHAGIGIAALDAGLDVLLEKPMAPSVAECDALIAAARRNDRVLTIGHEFRLSGQWGSMKKIIEGGEIGRPRYANVSLFRFPYRPGSSAWRYDQRRVGSWILEEPVHFFDSLMWYFQSQGDPVSLHAIGNSKQDTPGMYDNFSTVLRWPGDLYAMVTQTLSGFEHHHVMEVAGTEGSIRTWWSGAMDRTRDPKFELKVQRRGKKQCEIVGDLGASGEVFELQEELRLVVEAFRARRPLVSPEEARKRIVVCVEAERSARENRVVELRF
ncbi:MAG: Gfo/Idh/MocA family oxidoreductase [Betaproteobacteria bacterium]|nr:Gfo/Idh/MocA family oxidoreductase [Betaproteobacteria bacterium]